MLFRSKFNNNKNTSGSIDDIKHNVENSNFAGKKNRKSFDVEKVDDLNDSGAEEDKGSDQDNSKPKNKN